MRYTYRAKLIRCVDGDTFDTEIDLGFSVWTKLRFRLLDVDTPERGEPGFHEATKLLETFIEQASVDGTFELESHKTGKYGRWLARLGSINYCMAQWVERKGWLE